MNKVKGGAGIKVKSGYAGIVGRPNVGKSTLLNNIIGQKIAIVTPKAQTTRNRILGIKTLRDCQIIFIDTPGIHKPFHELGNIMVKSAMNSIKDVDVVLCMVTPRMPTEADFDVIGNIVDNNKNNILLINKIDTVKKDVVLPIIHEYTRRFSFDEVIPISALKGDGVDILLDTVKKYLPEGPKLYPDDIMTDRIERSMVSEIIREKLIFHTREEIPYSAAVEVVRWDEKTADALIDIEAVIYVERESQKGIIIGNKGNMLKRIGSAARKEIEDLFGTGIFLSLWVKVKKDWRDNQSFLKEIGIN